MSSIFEFISYICPITGNDLIDTILFAVITAIAFKIAWSLTGSISDETNSHDSGFMSSLHWLIRILIFVALLAIVIGLVHLVHWITSWQWWVYLIIGIVFIHLLVALIVLASLRKRRKLKKETVCDSEKIL